MRIKRKKEKRRTGGGELGSVGRWSSGKKEEGPQKITAARVHNLYPDPSIGMILSMAMRICKNNVRVFHTDLPPSHVKSHAVNSCGFSHARCQSSRRKLLLGLMKNKNEIKYMQSDLFGGVTSALF